jgi:K+-sensing histidine kinase KdpD
VVVRDQGIGIETHDLDAIFAGYRTELARLVSSGSGVGLGLSRRLVEAEGGQLGVSSRPGRGSAFWVDLPIEMLAATSVHTTPTARRSAPAAFAGIDGLREEGVVALPVAVRDVG